MLDEHRNYRSITYKEIASMLLTAAVIGFIMSFRDWGQDSLDIAAGLSALIVAAMAAFAIILIRTWTQKWIALKLGYLTTYTFHKYALPVSFFLAFFLNGIIPYVAPGDLKIQESKRLRLGTFRYGLNYEDLAIISMAAPIASILIMIVVKPVFLATNNPLIHEIVRTAAFITIFGMLPIKGQEGLHILYFRRWLWVISFIFLGVYFLLILAVGVFSYVVAAIIGIIGVTLFKTYIDSSK